MSINVKTFDLKGINNELKGSSKELQQYVKTLKESSISWEELTQKAIRKIQDQNNVIDILKKNLFPKVGQLIIELFINGKFIDKNTFNLNEQLKIFTIFDILNHSNFLKPDILNKNVPNILGYSFEDKYNFKENKLVRILNENHDIELHYTLID